MYFYISTYCPLTTLLLYIAYSIFFFLHPWLTTNKNLRSNSCILSEYISSSKYFKLSKTA